MGESNDSAARWPTLIQSKVVFTAYRQHLAANDIGKTMRKAFGQPESPSLIKTLSTKFKPILRCFYDNLDWIETKTGLVHQVRQLTTQEDVELADVDSVGVEPVGANPDSKPQRYPWTRAHSLYSTMGGFAVDTRGLDRSYLPEGRQRMTLKPEALKFIAKHTPDLLPDLPGSAIVDKSKANAFTKLVTCGQAIWFCVQCATRSAEGLSISLLEINTAVHAICTLIMYFRFWWHKPLDVEEPTILTHADTHPVIAFLVIIDLYPHVHLSPMDLDDDGDDDLDPDAEDVISFSDSSHILLRTSKDPRFPKQDFRVHCGFAILTTRSGPPFVLQNLTKLDFERFELASEAAKKHGLVTPPPDEQYYLRRDLLDVRVRNRPKMGNSNLVVASTLLGFPLAGFFYGSIHLLVWNRPFRSETDGLLWKISSLNILISGIPIAIAYWTLIAFDNHFARLPRWMQSPSKKLAWLFLACVVLFYVLCRTFIIVECFLDVFHLPDSAFEVPQWSQYFPHIG